MLLVRHNRLQKPFDNYETLSTEQLDDLATGKHEHNARIQNISTLEGISEELQEKLRHPSVAIVCSASRRTQETCSRIIELLGLQKDISIDPRLNELWFSPLIMLPPGYVGNRLRAVRDRIYSSMFLEEPCVEPLQKVQQRVEGLLHDYNNEYSVCFSHGFLIRYIKALVEAEKKQASIAEIIENIDPIGYLEVTKLD